MLGDLTEALSSVVPASSVFILSLDDQAASIAASFGFSAIADDIPRDLNSSIARAAERLSGKGFNKVLILHADLPFVNSGALHWIWKKQKQIDCFLIADSACTGTNGMCIPLPLPFKPAFGQDSLTQHITLANTSGLDFPIISRHDFAWDIDKPADFEELRALKGSEIATGPRVRDFLCNLGERTRDAKDDNFIAATASDLAPQAATIAEREWGRTMTYSRKVFIPLTRLCRDVCHYCTFATRPASLRAPYLTIDEVLDIARKGEKAGCKEALFTLGDTPEARYGDAKRALDDMGFETTLAYVAAAARTVSEQTSLIPHINAGILSEQDIAMFRSVSASAGLMLESGSRRLTFPGAPHHGSPDKVPGRRIAVLEALGRQSVPTTTGLLVGIGETRAERLTDLRAIAELHRLHGHIQEVIVQNFRAKPGTRMASMPDAPLEELLWTISAARIILPPDISIQAPPNLNPGVVSELIAAGINDWGGISPVTPDHVNPEAPWPEIMHLEAEMAKSNRHLEERLTIYPAYVVEKSKWADIAQHSKIDRLTDAMGFARSDTWMTGRSNEIPPWASRGPKAKSTWSSSAGTTPVRDALTRVRSSIEAPSEHDVITLFSARDEDFDAVLAAADERRAERKGDAVTYVINRNINYTNICYFKCQFCGFSKGKTHSHLRGAPYNIGLDEIRRRVLEAEAKGATEVCLQGGIHPEYTGQTYLDICSAIREAAPNVHIHAFSPLEVAQGAKTLNLSLEAFLRRLMDAGLKSLPGTAAEVLDDEVRAQLCHDKLNTNEWFEVVETAHRLGLKTTSTIMFGHIDRYEHWARHLLRLRASAAKTGGFTEFVPLPFVAHEAPIFLHGKSRAGPTLRETLLMHAVGRLVLDPHITNIQASWVKLGSKGLQKALEAGVNDVGGTLMDETITRSSGGMHGSNMTASKLRKLIEECDRIPKQRTTLYKTVAESKLALASKGLQPM